MTDLPHEAIAGTATEVAEGPQSAMEQLRAARREVAETKELYLNIPGYDALNLRAKYRLMERPEMEAIGKKIKKETRDRGDFQMLVLCDVIINACEGFFLGDDPLTFSDSGKDPSAEMIVSYDRLAAYLDGNHVQTAREGLYYVFGDNEFAIGQHGIKLNRWFQNTGIEVDDEFLGEG